MSGSSKLWRASLLAGGAMIAGPELAHAQAAGPAEPPAAAAAQEIGEVIVTARKRNETLIQVPVAISAVSSTELARSAVNSADGLARKVPGLLVGEGGGTLQGGTLALRGISAADGNPLGDQALSFNIDGVQVARSSVRRMGDFDIEGVQVLKGPQALFYGKNSPGGIISIRSNDPTSRLEGGGRLGYEGNAKEWRGEGYLSFPITENLGARVAVFGSTMKGWVDNLVPANDPFAPNSRTSPNREEWAFRSTFKFDNGPFDARLKIAYNHVTDNGFTSNYQIVDCPAGSPEFGTIADCRADDRIVQAALGPAFGALVPNGTTVPAPPPGLAYSDFGNGALKSLSKQWLAGLEMNYDIAPELKLTSVTGLYKLDFSAIGNLTQVNFAPAIVGSLSDLDLSEISEEIRLTSSFSGPLNFMTGVQYQSTRGNTATLGLIGATPGIPTVLGGVSPLVITDNYFKQIGTAYSIFAQVQYVPIPQIEISAGGRYSHEEKTLKSVFNRGAQLVGVAPALSNGRNDGSWSNFSPEISISYRPTRDLNIYANYKKGFLSGGFNTGAPSAAATSFSYLPENVEGFEGGVKGRFLDGLLDLDLAAYSYKITGLQVQVTLGTVQLLQNAGKVSTKGAELGLTLHPTKALSIYSNVAYQHGRYDQYFANCYTGQAAVAPGTGIGQCAAQATPNDPSGLNRYQNLAGTELVRSPEWSGNVGVNYEAPIGDSMKLDLSSSLTFSSSYVTGATSQPRSRSPQYTLLNATVRLAEVDDKWEIALIGNNLTDKYYWTRSSDNPYGGGRPTQLADTIAVPSRGREVWVRVGFKY